MKGILTAITLALGAIVALPAQAQTFNGQTRGMVALRAGPDAGYPQVAMLPAGANVTIYGCVDDWSWCDVQWRHERGWVSAGMLDTHHSGRYYTVGVYSYDLGIPILSFIIYDYWSRHYWARPWYRQAPKWYSYRPNRPNRHIRPPVYGPRPPAYLPPVHDPRPPYHGHWPGQGRPDWGRDRNHRRDREWNRGENHHRNREWGGDRNRNEVRRPDVQQPPSQRQIQQIRRERVEQRIQRQQEK